MSLSVAQHFHDKHKNLRTKELAQSKTPPMGAKTIPTMKKRGSTLLGVKIGLTEASAHKVRQHPMKEQDSLPSLQSLLPESSICKAGLAGDRIEMR